MNIEDRVQADANACLAFLVQRQDEWKPGIRIMHHHEYAELPLTLIASDAETLGLPLR